MTQQSADAQRAELSITKARIELLTGYPWFGALALRLMVREAAPGELPIPTIGTDGRFLIYDTGFVNSINRQELLGVICHEIMHCAAGHPWRRGHREPGLWNVAGDLAINPLIVASGFTLPRGTLLDPQFNGMSAEEIYAKLPRSPSSACGCGGVLEPQSGSGGDGDNDGNSDGHGHGQEHGHGLSAADRSQLDADWRIAVAQATEAAKQAGALPAGLQRFSDAATRPSVDWKAVLRRFLTSRVMDDYRTFPPNRRFLQQKLYLPSCRSERCGDIVIGVDTSGSIGAHELNQFCAELNAILEDVKPTTVYVVYCDAAVAATETFTTDQLPVRMEARGGGGTAFSPVFDWVRDNHIQPECLIYLTDLELYGQWPADPRDYPVLWAATTETKVAPWGETVPVIISRD